MKKQLKHTVYPVAAGSKAVLDLPIGPSYEKVRFLAAGAGLTAAHFGKVNLILDGQVKSTITLDKLIALNSYYGYVTDTASDFTLHFSRREFFGLADKLGADLGTLDRKSVQIEVELLSGSPITSFRAESYFDTLSKPTGVILGYAENVFTTSVAGWNEFLTLPKNYTYKAIHLFKPDVTAVEQYVSNVQFLDADKTGLERIQKDSVCTNRVPQSAVATHLDYTLNGSVSDAMSLSFNNEHRLKMNLTTAGTVTIISERFLNISAGD